MNEAQGVVLSGGSGFIGRALTMRLQALFPEVHVISRKYFDTGNFENVQHYQSSLDNDEILKKLLPRCCILVHLASDTTPGSSAFRPTIEATNTILPTLRLLECLQNFPEISLVYVSTGGAIYGNVDMETVAEVTPLSPLSYYGAGKAAIENFISAYCHQTRNKAIILRPSNVYGPGQQYREGFGLIPTIFNNLVEGKAITVWGEGKTVRDFLYIDDFVDFCCALLKSNVIEAGRNLEVYNVGSGVGYSVEEILRTVESVTGKEIARVQKPARAVDVQRIVLDSSKAARNFSWNVQVGLESGLKKTWDWFRRNLR